MGDHEPARLPGRCACGAARYQLTGPPLIVHCCHCTWCQRENGSAFAVNALIEADRLQLTAGKVVTTVLPSASGNGQVFARCPACGVTLWSHYAAAGDRVHFVRVGTLDDPSACRPDVHIYTSTRQPWVRLPEDVPAFPGFYRPRDVWPEESLARLAAAQQSSAT
ncbi:GFA family protein [Emcibacter sp. SYSU 3D8]|uniref:GFA family protein n=1 Tax=Emcibacter sp. SYSU 3D8 TaxID=3133969 RepID=UPI0031FE70A1